MNLATYLVSVLATEVIEDVKMIKDIIHYHYQERQHKKKLNKQANKIKKKMSQQKTYEQWKHYAQQYDNLPQNKNWRKKVQCKEYDYKYIQEIRDKLRHARENNQDQTIIHILRSHCFRNIANILNKPLYTKLYCNTKILIEQFMLEVKQCTQYLIASQNIPQSVKIEFFVEQKHALGRTALIISGGGLFAMYSFGIIEIMIEQDLMPQIIAGSSAGSIITALVCSQTTKELKRKITEDGQINFDPFLKSSTSFFAQFARRTKRLLTEGVLLDIKLVEDFIQVNIGDITFQEAFDKTGRIMNITVTGQDQHSTHRLLNYITAPNVVVWSAVACSCSIPAIYGPSKLKCKNENGEIIDYLTNTKFVDGSIGGDLPMLKLAELFNTTHFIVSQTNPFIVPFVDRYKKRESKKISLILSKIFDFWKNMTINEIRHRFRQFSQLNLVPHSITMILAMFDQQYQGNITVFPQPSISDYLQILEVPSSDQQIRYFRQHGYEQTFEQIYEIKMNTFYERIIEKGYKVLCKQAQQNIPMNIQEQDNGEFLLEIQQKGSEIFLNNNNKTQEDEIDILKTFQKKRKGSLRTGMSQVFDQFDEDIQNQINDQEQQNDGSSSEDENNNNKKQQKKQNKTNLPSKQRNISFTIPRSQSKQFLDNLSQIQQQEQQQQYQKIQKLNQKLQQNKKENQ